MTHTYHEKLPNYNAAQILHDGCAECEARAASRNHGIAHLDRFNFVHAWARAAQWNRHGLSNIATAEIPMFDVLWAIQCQLENYGWPIGEVPSGAGTVSS
jgi:hypothetical protein